MAVTSYSHPRLTSAHVPPLAPPAFIEGGRDLRIDFLRGLFVITMIVDHVAGASWLHAVTGGNHFYTSAAEGFVFVSGLVAGRAYTRFIDRGGLGYGLHRLLRRAGQLYLLSVVLTLVFVPASEMLKLPWALGWDLHDSVDFVVSVITLHRTYYLVDVLALYVFLLVASTLVFVLLVRGQTALVLGGSWLIWLLYQVFPDQVSMPWTIAGNNLFYFAAWQVLFVTGVVIGYHWEQAYLTPTHIGSSRALQWPGSPRWRRLALWISGAMLALFVALHLAEDSVLAFVLRGASDPASAQANLLTLVVGKSDLRLGRLVVFAVVFVLLFLATTEWWTSLRRWVGWLVLPLGQHALFAYSAHVLIALAVAWLLQASGGLALASPTASAALQLISLALIWVLIRLRPIRASVADRRLQFGAPLVLVALALAALPRMAPEVGTSARTSDGRAEAATSAAVQVARAYGTAIPDNTEPEVPAAALAPPVAQPDASAAPSASGNGIDPPLQGTLVEPEFYSAALNTTERYFIYLPPGYRTSGQRFPVLYMLHGGSGRTEWVDYDLVGTADREIGAGKLPPMLIVLPQGDNGYWVNHTDGGPQWGDYLARDMVRHIDSTYATLPDARHRAIGGLSMGGWGALYQALAHPDEFSIVGGHAASLHKNDGSLAFLPRGQAFDQFDPMQLAAVSRDIAGLRVWLDAGDKDPWVSRAADLHVLLDRRQISNEWHVFPGRHGGSYWHDHVQDYLDFYGRSLASN